MAAVEYRSPVAPGFLFWLRRVPRQFCDQLLDALVRRLKLPLVRLRDFLRQSGSKVIKNAEE